MMPHLLVLLTLIPTVAPEPAASWQAGVAVRKITPAGPMWMAGYAGRNRPAEGTEHDLFVKALALQDPTGNRFVLLTSDLVGIPRSLSEKVASAVTAKTGLDRSRLVLTVSHTHCGPVIADNLVDMYPMPDAEAARIGPYTDRVRVWMIEAIVEALSKLAPAQVSVGQGTARFAVNRRKITPKGVLNDSNPEGPVDHAVPVLRVDRPGGGLLAVAFGYACHNTTLPYYRWCGDYAGFAQIDLQERHKGAVALFWMGCGGDANPLPRGTVEHARRYGKQLADAVDAVLSSKTTPLNGRLAARYATVELLFDRLPSKEQIAADLLSKTHAIRKRAEKFAAIVKSGGQIDDRYRHYPVQVVHLGDQVTWVTLGGEVVVDYSLRLKKELAGRRTVWVAGYANDVMAYIPSERVLKEGGYEGDSSMIYYGMPSKWRAGLENRIVGKVRELERQLQDAQGAAQSEKAGQ
jgi:neutral ceramidase